MDIAIQLFQRIDDESGEAVDPLDGVLTVDGLPHQRVIVARMAITDPHIELIGEATEFWGQCVPAGRRALPDGPPELWESVTMHDPGQQEFSFNVPVLVLASVSGNYEVAVYARRSEVARTSLVIAVDG